MAYRGSSGGATADMMGSAKARCGGLYTVAITPSESKIVGVVKFPLQHIVNNSNKRKKSSSRGRQKKLIWYCPFSASSVNEDMKMSDFSIDSEDLYFLGTQDHLRACYRSNIPRELLDSKFYSGIYHNRSGIRFPIYRVPISSFNSTFFSGKGRHLARSLDIFVTAVLAEDDFRFHRATIKKNIDLTHAMSYSHSVDTLDQVFQAELYRKLI